MHFPNIEMYNSKDSTEHFNLMQSVTVMLLFLFFMINIEQIKTLKDKWKDDEAF